MIYIDSSCLLKLVQTERETEAISAAVARETTVIISALAELETIVQLKARFKAGAATRTEWRKAEALVFLLRNHEPYRFTTIPGAIWPTALRQHRNSQNIHCRTLDRLHLATMEELNLKRLMTHDISQAAAARDLGFEVIEPGR